MWYLSRTPSNRKPNDDSNFSLRNSIFTVSDSGFFQDICMIEVPNKSVVDHEEPNKEEEACPFSFSFPKWEWFAYLCSPTQFHSVAVPRDSSMFRVQVIGILPQHFLCAKLVRGPKPYVTLCNYSCSENSLNDVPKMNCADRNLFGAACAILDGWLYVAGGYKDNSLDTSPSSQLNSAERLNLKTWQWEALQNMPNPRAFASGIAHGGRFFVVGGGNNAALKHSAEIYNPSNNSWGSLKSFVPQEADGFTATSLNGRLMILTWSDQLGVKLWMYTVITRPILIYNCRRIGFLPNQIVERPRLKAHGARMVPVGGKEVWVLVGENERIFQVDGSSAWPVFPAPMYKPGEGHEVVSKGHIYAFSFHGVRISWRQIPVYSV
ncbi:hypothetical protein ABKV19_003505 [Rosa sericea]